MKKVIRWSCSDCKEGGEEIYPASLEGESEEYISTFVQGVHRAVSPRCARKKGSKKKISWEIKET